MLHTIEFKSRIIMSAATVIKERLAELNMTQTELATAIGTTRQNFANKMARDNFSAKELFNIGNVLNLKLAFKDDNGKEFIINYESEAE